LRWTKTRRWTARRRSWSCRREKGQEEPDGRHLVLADREREERERREREELRQQYLKRQEEIKQEPITVVFSYWDGHGHRSDVEVSLSFNGVARMQ